MVDDFGRIVLWMLLAEAGILLLAVCTYLAITIIRGRDLGAQVAELRGNQAEMEGWVQKALKRLSPGRPRDEPQPQTVAGDGDRPRESADGRHPGDLPRDERLRRMQAIRASFQNRFGR